MCTPLNTAILTRPAVEAGESLGFLPGDLKEKVDPYLRPIYDALNSILGADHVERLMDRGVIEIAPLAYMRGRTLDNAFVILEIDLPHGAKSGLISAQQILKGIEAIEFVHFQADDVVRHPVVAKIITAYETPHEDK